MRWSTARWSTTSALLKHGPRTLIDAFDHAVAIWSGNDPDYIAACQRFSDRWIRIPVPPSAEQFSRLFVVLIDRLLDLTEMTNGETDVRLHSVISHETETSYAQCFREDAINPRMGLILSRRGWSPFAGRRFHSRIATTVVSGRIAWHEGQLRTDCRSQALSFLRDFPVDFRRRSLP